jgi:hypothetical protein
MEHPDFGRICECECHRDNGPRIFCSCFGQCCDFEQKKFFNEDGTVDVARFRALVMERRLREKGKDRRKRREIPPFTKYVFPRIKGGFPKIDLSDKEKP